MSASIRGVMATVNRISEMGRAHGKRHMSVWRLCWLQMEAMMSRYNGRYGRKKASRNCYEKLEKLMRMNSDTVL